jgi:hypothetical protein
MNLLRGESLGEQLKCIPARERHLAEMLRAAEEVCMTDVPRMEIFLKLRTEEAMANDLFELDHEGTMVARRGDRGLEY